MFNWRVPNDCRAAFDGKKVVTRSLKTHSKREAKLRRDVLLGECRKIVADIRSDSGNEYKDAVKALIPIYDNFTAEELANTYEATADLIITGEFKDASVEACRIVYHGKDTATIKPTLKDAFDVYECEQASKIMKKTLLNYKTSLRYFLEFNQQNDMVIEDITKGVVRNYIKSCRSSGQKERSIGNRVRHLASIFSVAQNDGLIPDSKVNPFANHRLSRKGSIPYQLFPNTVLEGIFKETLKYRTNNKDFHKYLLPRLGYTTGARREELCSLRIDQVRTKNGISYLQIATSAEDVINKELRDSYEGKNENAIRQVPIHSSLVEEVLSWKEKQKGKLLFPALKADTLDGKMGDAYGKSFGRLKTGLGAKGRLYAFHSFRDHMATALERARVPENEAVWIIGHTRTLSLSYGLYSKGPDLETLKENIEKAIILPKHFL